MTAQEQRTPDQPAGSRPWWWIIPVAAGTAAWNLSGHDLGIALAAVSLVIDLTRRSPD